MEYKCRTVDASRLNVTTQGFFMPLCDSCTTRDCSNPVELMKISILGIKKEVRTYSRGSEIRFVVECEGYVK
jgi:hypothetical protein